MNADCHSQKTATLGGQCCNEEVGSQDWAANAPVTVISTVHGLGSEASKVEKRPGAKSANTKEAREALGGGESIFIYV